MKLPNYTHYYNFRKNTLGGGASIYIHDDIIRHELIEEKCEDDNHYVLVHIEKFSLNIGAVYKPERTNHSDFLEIFTQFLLKKRRAIIIGDLNYDLLTNDKPVRDYKGTLRENGYKILNKTSKEHCTRETSTTKTILDHVSTNLKEISYKITLIDSSLSDHKQIYMEVFKHTPEAPKRIEYTAIDYKSLYMNIQEQHCNLEHSEYKAFENTIHESVKMSKISKTKILSKSTTK